MSITLITGADGHVGAAMSRWLLEHTDNELLLYVRAADEGEIAYKRRSLGSLANNPRCHLRFGDLRSPDPFAGVDVDAITEILHCAAVTNFAVDRQTAQTVNIDGTQKLIDLATRCRRLRRFGLVSTLYTAGLREGVLPEAPFDEAPQFANHYEWSKWRAEQLLLENQHIPWHVYRVATILGEDGSGLVVQQNAIHNTLRLHFYGLLSVIPGKPDTRVYAVTTGFAASAIGKLFVGADDQRVFHISDAGSDAMTLGQMMDTAHGAFSTDPKFARQRILKPLFCDLDSFDTLVKGSAQFGGAISQSLQSLAPFAPQLYSDKDVQTWHSTAALGGLRAHNTEDLLRAVCGYLVETRWGLNALNRSAAQ